jgi:hypothetical protein
VLAGMREVNDTWWRDSRSLWKTKPHTTDAHDDIVLLRDVSRDAGTPGAREIYGGPDVHLFPPPKYRVPPRK